MDTFFRITAFILHIARWLYWIVTEIEANREKPKKEPWSWQKLTKRFAFALGGIVMLSQLIGLQLLRFESIFWFQLLGFIFVVTGVWVTIVARKTLGTNWAHAAEFQIRKNHTLVTDGVYAYVRHPLYTGIFFAVLGAEMVAESYLFLFVLILGMYFGYKQAKREEKILMNNFGSEYAGYMERTKKFLPLIW